MNIHEAAKEYAKGVDRTGEESICVSDAEAFEAGAKWQASLGVMDGIDLNDNVSIELTEWGATYLNAANIFKNATIPQKYRYKTDYKAGDAYQNQLWQLMLDFKDGIRFDKEKAFKNLKKVITK